MEHALRELLARFAGQRVLVLGDVMLDEYIWGETRRVSPEAPVPVVEFRQRSFRAGGAANAALNVTSLGGQALLGGTLGADEAAQRLRELLTASNLDVTGLVVDSLRPTTTKTRILTGQRQVLRLDQEETRTLPHKCEESLHRWVQKTLPGVHLCVLSDYAKGVLSPRLLHDVIALARQHRIPVLVDPKGADYARYAGATLLKPNLHEAEQFSGCEIRTDADLVRVADQVLQHVDEAALLVTRGAQGMTLFRRRESPVHIPARARTVFDVTGAGDTVAATLALTLAAGGTLEEAALLATYAAGIAVSRVGTALVSLDDLRAELVEPATVTASADAKEKHNAAENATLE